MRVDDSKPTSETSYGISASSNTVTSSHCDSVAGETKTVTDDVSSVNEQLDKSAAHDDIVESSSPLRRDDDDDNSPFTGVVVPTTTSTATCTSVIPPALSSLPSLMQLSRQALAGRALRLTSEESCSSTAAAAPTDDGDMFSDDDEHDDSLSEMTEVNTKCWCAPSYLSTSFTYIDCIVQ